MISVLTTVAPKVIAQVRLLVVVILLLAMIMVAQFLWQSHQQEKTSDLLSNYHSASIQYLGVVRNEIQLIRSDFRDASHQKQSGENFVEQRRTHHEITQSLHIIKEMSGHVFAIQRAYQHPGFTASISELQAQLEPAFTLIDEDVSVISVNALMEVVNTDALLLTLNQIKRLHAIENNALSEMSIRQRHNHTIAMFSFLVIMVLIGGFVIKRVFSSIGTILLKQKDTEEKLFQEKERLHTTLNSIGDAVITTDAEGFVTRMNPVAEQLTGWTLEEAQGEAIRTIFPIINADTHEPVQNPIEKVMAAGEIVYLSNHTTLIAKDGAEYQIADSAAPIRDGDGDIQGMVLVFNDVTEQYRLREKANAVHQQLQALLDDMQTMVAILAVDGSVTFCNNTPLKIAGLKEDDVLGKKLWDCPWLSHDLKEQGFIQEDIKASLLGKLVLRDLQIATSDGLLWVEFSIHSVRDEFGTITQLVAEGRDIHQRKKVEQDLHSSSQHLKLYREQAPLATIEWDTDFQVVNWNRAAEKMFGFTLDEAKGRDFVDTILTKDSIVGVNKIWKELISQTGGEISINENLTKDGSVIVCEWHNTPLIDESGKTIGAASIVLNRTTEYKVQHMLLNKEQEQREILNSMVDAVITIDENGIIQTFNQSAETLFGYTFDEILGKNIDQLVSGAFDAEDDTALKHYLETGLERVNSIGRELEGRQKNGSIFPMRLSVAELSRDSEGKRRFIGSCMNLTKIKQQQEQLRRSQKMDALGKLTGGIAHDFNNMLGVVMGYASLLEGRLHGQPKLENYVQQILHAGERGTRLTKKLLSSSRQKNSDAEVLNVNTLLLNLQNMLEKTLTARIKLVFELAEDLWPSMIDGSDMEDAILNICINAMHAMEGGGQLAIRTSNESIDEAGAVLVKIEAGDYVLLSITDTGCGIDDAIKEKIFDPFFSTKGEQGTGLGLSQVYGFVERSGGVINVYSERGHGTQFMIYLPRYRDVNTADQKKAASQIANLRGSETILVVDDEPALLALAAETLGQQGYHVICAGSSESALEALETESIDLLLSDVVMPGMDGYQLARTVQEKYPTVKIQLASGFSDDRHLNMIDDSLHQGLINKPYRLEFLLKKIRELLDSASPSA